MLISTQTRRGLALALALTGASACGASAQESVTFLSAEDSARMVAFLHETRTQALDATLPIVMDAGMPAIALPEAAFARAVTPRLSTSDQKGDALPTKDGGRTFKPNRLWSVGVFR